MANTITRAFQVGDRVRSKNLSAGRTTHGEVVAVETRTEPTRETRYQPQGDGTYRAETVEFDVTRTYYRVAWDTTAASLTSRRTTEITGDFLMPDEAPSQARVCTRCGEAHVVFAGRRWACLACGAIQ